MIAVPVEAVPVDAAPVRERLQARSYERLEGANSDAVEIWIGPDQDTICLAYFRRGDRSQFFGRSVEDAGIDTDS